jgi:hypothetical protein
MLLNRSRRFGNWICSLPQMKSNRRQLFSRAIKQSHSRWVVQTPINTQCNVPRQNPLELTYIAALMFHLLLNVTIFEKTSRSVAKLPREVQSLLWICTKKKMHWFIFPDFTRKRRSVMDFLVISCPVRPERNVSPSNRGWKALSASLRCNVTPQKYTRMQIYLR